MAYVEEVALEPRAGGTVVTIQALSPKLGGGVHTLIWTGPAGSARGRGSGHPPPIRPAVFPTVDAALDALLGMIPRYRIGPVQLALSGPAMGEEAAPRDRT
jgi:hypothetical protein